VLRKASWLTTLLKSEDYPSTDLQVKDIAIIVSGTIAAVSTLSAVSITSWFNLRVTKLNIDFQGKQKEKERKLDKIEEMYFLFEKWKVNCHGIYIKFYCCYLRQMKYQDMIKSSKESTLLAFGDAQKINVLMRIYFPELTDHYKSVEDFRSKIIPFLSDPDKSKLSADDFLNALNEFDAMCEDFKQRISDFAQKL